MAKIRAYRAEMTGSVAGKIRAYRAELTGTALVLPRIRAYRAAMTGVASVIVADLPSRQAGPGEIVALTGTLLGGAEAQGWTWRQISGPTVPLSQSGPNVAFTAPSLWPPAGDVVLGVRAVVGSTQSAEKTVTITILPQLEWSRVHGGQWVGAVVAPAGGAVFSIFGTGAYGEGPYG